MADTNCVYRFLTVSLILMSLSCSTEPASNTHKHVLLVPRKGMRLRLRDFFNSLRRTGSCQNFETIDVLQFELPNLAQDSKFQLIETATRYDARVLSYFLSCSHTSTNKEKSTNLQNLSLAHLVRVCRESLTVRQNIKLVHRYCSYFFEMSATFSEVIERVPTMLAIDPLVLQQASGQVPASTLARLIVFTGSHASAGHLVVDVDELDYSIEDFMEGGLASYLLQNSIIFIGRNSKLLNSLKAQFGITEIHTFSLETRSDDSRLAIENYEEVNELSLEDQTHDLLSIGLPESIVSKAFVTLEKVDATGSTKAGSLECGSGFRTLEVESSDRIWLNCQLVVGNVPSSADLFAIISSTSARTIEIPLDLQHVLPTLSGRVTLTLCIDLSKVSGDRIGVGVVLKDVLTESNITRVNKALLLQRTTDVSNIEMQLSTFAARLELL